MVNSNRVSPVVGLIRTPPLFFVVFSSENDFFPIVNCPQGEQTPRVELFLGGKSRRNFYYDHVFGPEAEQLDVYDNVAGPIVHGTLNGLNGAIFAYGQTGSGKTYTMVAMQNRAAEEIFQNLQQEGNLGNTKIICTFFEIYGGRCIDLLNRRKKLTIREDGKGNVVVGGLCEEQVTTKEELLQPKMKEIFSYMIIYEYKL